MNLKLYSFLRELPQKNIIREFPEFCLIILLCLFILPISIQAQELKRFSYSEQKMGTEFRIVFFCESDSLANEIKDVVFKEIDDLNSIFSDYDIDSELNRIVRFNGNDTIVSVSLSLYQILKTAQLISKETNGAFDVTIGPLSKLWRRAIRRKEIPSEDEIEKAKNLVDFRNISLIENESITLSHKGIKLDLGGIAKGATVDAVFELINSFGIDKVLVDGGGDIRVGESPPNSSGWQIQLSRAKMWVQNMAFATSGDTYKYLKHDGKRYSHIIDPRTGYGIQNAQNVMVHASSCKIADAIASAASILDKIETVKLESKFDVKIFYDP